MDTTFLSADSLGISEAARQALIVALDAFKGGRIRHVKEFEYVHLNGSYDPNAKFDGLFNMGDWISMTNCGTVACIGGIAELLSPGFSFGVNDDGDELDNLFYDYSACESDTTVEQATEALHNYLTTGDAMWSEVLK